MTEEKLRLCRSCKQTYPHGEHILKECLNKKRLEEQRKQDQEYELLEHNE